MVCLLNFGILTENPGGAAKGPQRTFGNSSSNLGSFLALIR